MKRYNYIIVGAGSAGCVLANRLSRDPACEVLLIESGPKDSSFLISLPRGYALLMGDPKHSWAYPATRSSSNEVEAHIRGRTLGGSSAINGMIYARGLARDYEGWNIPGWGWSDFLRAYRKIESHEFGSDNYRGGEGELEISSHSYDLPLCDAVIRGGSELGVPVVEDFNCEGGERIAYSARNIWKGRRVSASAAFLKPVRSRANLDIMTGVNVDKLVLEGKKAVGVIVSEGDGRNRHIWASQEVILSAGAINTPKLMQLSGIGPGQLLHRHGIETVVDSPNVGANFSDHRYFSLQFRVNGGSDNKQFSGWRLIRNVMQQMILGTGPMSRPAFEVGAYIKTDPTLDLPDFRMLMGTVSLDKGAAKIAMERSPGFNIGGFQMLPRSRGFLEISSADPDETPSIVSNAFAAQEDVDCAVRAVRKIRELAATEALSIFDPRETTPGDQVQSDDEVAEYVKRTSGSGMHICGTCQMGSGSDSVVDENLRVRGVEGLRIADISIMPGLISGNTNAPAMAIGQLASEKILARPFN